MGLGQVKLAKHLTDGTRPFMNSPQNLLTEQTPCEMRADNPHLRPDIIQRTEKRGMKPALAAPSAHAQIGIFNLEEIDYAIKHCEESDAEKLRRHILDLTEAKRSNGQRQLPQADPCDIIARLDALKETMPNFSNVIDVLKAEFALALAGHPENFRITPICMNGVPGIGKTHFVRELAAALNVGWEAINLGATGGFFELCGLAQGWGSSRAGRLFRLLASNESACPIVLLDEVDKMQNDSNCPALPVVLEVVEHSTARKLRDEGLEVRFDASRIIFLATSNELDNIPRPLQSRMLMVDILPPTPKQRRVIAERIVAGLLGGRIKFQSAALDALAEADIDLRELNRIIRQTTGIALAAGRRHIRLNDIQKLLTPYGKKKNFGFLHN